MASQTSYAAFKKGIKDYQAELSLHQTLLQNRIWGVNFAVDYIARLEIKDGGWGQHTREIVQKEQQVLPPMRNKVCFAEIRLQLCKNLLAQFELMHRLVVSARARFQSGNPEDWEKMDRGMKLFDSEWKKMYEEHIDLQNLKSNDDSEKAQVCFLYQFELHQPNGTVETQLADASRGPIQLGEGMMGYRIGKPIIGLIGFLIILESQTEPKHRARTHIWDLSGSTTSDETGNGDVNTPPTPSKSDGTGNGEVNTPSTPLKKKKKRKTNKKKTTMPDLKTLKHTVEHDPVLSSVKDSLINRASYKDEPLLDIHNQEEHSGLRKIAKKCADSNTLSNRKDDTSNRLGWLRLEKTIERYFGPWTTSWMVLPDQTKRGTAGEETNGEAHSPGSSYLNEENVKQLREAEKAYTPLGEHQTIEPATSTEATNTGAATPSPQVASSGFKQAEVKEPREELKSEAESPLEEYQRVEQGPSTQTAITGTGTPSSIEVHQTFEIEASTQTTNTGTATSSSLENYQTIETEMSTQTTNIGTGTLSSPEEPQTIETEVSKQITNTSTAILSEQPAEPLSDRRHAAIAEMRSYSASLSHRIAKMRPTPALHLLLSHTCLPSTYNFGSTLFIDDTLIPITPRVKFKRKPLQHSGAAIQYGYFSKDHKAYYWMWRRVLSRAPRRYRRETMSLTGKKTWGGRRDERLF